MAILAATAVAPAIAAVQLCPYSTAAAGYHQATTVVSHKQLPMIQLWEAGPLCLRMPPA
jgi:hypothetical protein